MIRENHPFNRVSVIDIRRNRSVSIVLIILLALAFRTPQFGQEIPQSILTHKPLRILLQIVDTSHIRVGLKGEASDPWLFSEVFDTGEVFGEIAKFQLPCPVSFMAQEGSGVGNYPRLQQFMIDYIQYRYGLSD